MTLLCIPHSYDVVTGPTAEPVTVAECKVAARIDTADEDSYIADLIKTARELVETDTSMCLMSQTVRLNLDYFPAWTIELRRYPVQSVSSITYVDTAGDTQTASSSTYLTDITSFPPRVQPVYGQTWPTAREQARSVKVTFLAGHTSAHLVPSIAKDAIKTWVAMAIREREKLDYEPYEIAFNRLVARLRRFDMV